MKYKNIVASILIFASVAFAPLSALAAETGESLNDDNGNNIAINITDEKDLRLPSGSHTNQSELRLDWADIGSADSYELHSWSDTKAPSVRLLTTEQISANAVVTKLTQSEFDVNFIRDGNYYFVVKAIDSSGTVLQTSHVISLTFDKTAPKLFVINPKYDQEIIGNSLIANGTVSDLNLDYYYFILRDASGQTLLTSAQIKEAVLNDVIANLDISTFLSGSYDIAFVARDKAGNQTTLTDPDETASFIVVRKGDSNNFSSPPRPTEPAIADADPIIAPAQTSAASTPKFKLVSNQNVLGAASLADDTLSNLYNSPDVSDAKIVAIAKTPVRQSHNVLYLALIPILFCVGLVAYEKRQIATVKN